MHSLNSHNTEFIIEIHLSSFTLLFREEQSGSHQRTEPVWQSAVYLLRNIYREITTCQLCSRHCDKDREFRGEEEISGNKASEDRYVKPFKWSKISNLITATVC